MIRIADYPQLRDAAWYIAENAQFTDEEALAFYERNWKYIEEDKLQPDELALINRLVKEVGHGILNV
ncbi:hypothetical protein FJ875_23075 [Salmonella enterica]|uniref:hypothetical protein n=1 Tax=Salmonella enterica TaxID=28901 RepID=UPI0012D6815D|nr:hypothetical protein [Salmonella enterica]EGO1767065.1 hypothetical protein [Salmonella enterica subsp. diarizonae serovar Rough:-:-]MCH5483811.1 hypothetical protein [Salmonella enterica subsp. diarizonae serovar 16:z10:e,n,x,z15]ECU9822341.1 hypothetical protein [Salmonella enterica]EHT8580166.1 hypothetical protein [Salmonella enterica]